MVLKRFNKGLVAAIFLIFGLSISSCKKLVDVDAPYTNISAKNVYTNDATAAAVLTGIYAKISSDNINLFGSSDLGSLSLITALSSDELNLYNLNNDDFRYYFTNILTANRPNSDHGYWTAIYSYIFKCNAAIEGLDGSSNLSSTVKQQLLGESKFMRAYCYFYLVNLYGDVPLALTTDPLINSTLARSSSVQVYEQIVKDLQDAVSMLSADYLSGNVSTVTSERVRPTKWAAMALLARVYLYQKNYSDAEQMATAIINENSRFQLANLSEVFLKNNKESIWQLQSVGSNQTSANTGDARLFILQLTGPDNGASPVYMSPFLTSSFETGDMRKVQWVDSVVTTNTTYYYPKKYKAGINTSTGTYLEYLVIFRLAEMYLIRSEARAFLNNIPGGETDLNIIRRRAGLPDIAVSNKDMLVTAIFHERQVELFNEQGHRWLDLKRSGTINSVMNVVCQAKGGTWKGSWQYYPIPLEELKKDPKLIQNEGY